MSLYRTQRRMSHSYNDIPVGILAIQKLSRRCCPQLRSQRTIYYKASILGLTFLAYTCYHMTRKTISVVKSVLHTNCSSPQNITHDCGYAPFDVPDAQQLFGLLDSAFLFSYAAAMFVSGFIAERVSLRYFLSMGMILSGVFSFFFGVAKTANVHLLAYFIIVQMLAGIVQTTGWPGVVAVVGRWFGKSKRGFIFGVWNSHTSIGNILGTVLAAYYVERDWALSFMVPGIIIAVIGFVLFLFLVDSPETVGINIAQSTERLVSNDSDVEDGEEESRDVANRPTESTPILAHAASHNAAARPISLLDAINIPGVAEFSLCLFFSKLVSYTFLYWLPLYIQSSSELGPSLAAYVSVLFDVGGIVGAIAAGAISDYSGMSATTCAVMLFLSSPVLLLYEQYGTVSLSICIILLLISGLLVNGPYALITTSVSAELGQHSSLEGNSKALATVTAIIDGTGSIGAAVGPLLAGLISSHGWQHVFYMLIAANVFAMVLLVRLVSKELSSLRRRTHRIRIE